MGLTVRMTKDEIVGFIDKELMHQAKQEIETWVWPNKIQGGYFVVSRQILCMVDFLGAVYSGYPLKERITDKKGKNIATPEKAKKFITSFFKPKDIYTKDIVDKLYEMYRNGLVHLYQPKILRFGTKGKISWALYRGNSYQSEIKLPSNNGLVVFKDIRHLQIVPNKSNQLNYLLICIDSLYNDFEQAILTYRNRLSKTKSLQRKWRTAVNAICKPR